MILSKLFQGKVVAIYGPRRSGKTTLAKNIQKIYSSESIYFNCDEPDTRQALTDKTSSELINYIGNYKLVIIDEAQRVKNIGITLKLLVDNFSQTQIIATGSSSFDLSNKINEPLTGRIIDFFLPPFSLKEISEDSIETKRNLEQRMIYGSYPEVVMDSKNAKEIIREIFNKYLYKDVLEYQGLKNPDVLEKLLTALALQIGNEVSYPELATILLIDQKTVASYVRLLEFAFIIFRLPPLSRNLRKEIAKSRKIYFWDLGIRNAAINNFNSLEMRSDVGNLWENFLVTERMKTNQILRRFPNKYFWRTWSKEEIDYIEEEGGTFSAFEIKWSKSSKKPSKVWTDAYPNSNWKVITKENFLDFV